VAGIRRRKSSTLASRSVVSVLLTEVGDLSLHPQGRPCGRPPAAAVLGRLDPTATAEPASPSAPGQQWPTPWMPIAHAAVRRSEQTGHSQHRRSSAPTRLLTNLVERRRLARRANDGLPATPGGRASATCGLVWLVTVGRVGQVAWASVSSRVRAHRACGGTGRTGCWCRPRAALNLGPHPYQGSARGPVSPGSHRRPGRTMHRWRPLGTARLPWHVDQMWTTLVGTHSRSCRRAAAV
jgi:hypothetical protein